MTYTERINGLTDEIVELMHKSVAVRNQICLLEAKEAKISDLITTKRRQIDTLALFQLKDKHVFQD